MRKYIIMMAILVLGAIGVLASTNPTTVLRAESTQDLQAVIEINDNAFYENTTFKIPESSNDEFADPNDTNKTQVFLVNSGTLTLDGCSFVGDPAKGNETVSLSRIIKVNEGGKVILNNVTFNKLYVGRAVIESVGEVEITNTDFIEGRISVMNTSTKEDSLKYHSGNLHEVRLDNGSYITIFKDTIIDEQITISTNVNDLTEDDLDGRLMVKAIEDEVFASKYIDKFVYKQNLSAVDKDVYLDYVGDIEPSDGITGKHDVSLRSGDILLVKRDLSFTVAGTTYTYAPTNCTAQAFLKEETNEGERIITTLFVDGQGLALNNYTAAVAGKSYSRASTAGHMVTANVKVSVDGVLREEESKTYEFLSGSNHAIFVNIPRGDYEYKGVNITTQGTGNESLKVLDCIGYDDNNNGVYARPILTYAMDTYGSYEVDVWFDYETPKVSASIDVQKTEGVTVTHSQGLYAGDTCRFEVVASSGYRILNVTFNGSTVDPDNGLYEFERVLEGSNTIVVKSVACPYEVEVIPNPSKLTFEYGSVVSIVEENYLVEETGEYIDITYYAQEASNDAGEYTITTASCNDNNYVIKVKENSNVKYTITAKQIVLADTIELINEGVISREYEEGFVLDSGDYDLFIDTDSIPNGINAELLINGTSYVPKAGEQTLQIGFACVSNNYVIIGDTYIEVTLNIAPAELDVSKYQLVSIDNAQYDGTAKELEIVGDDLSKIKIKSYTNYLITSGGEELKSHAIDAGSYRIEVVIEAFNSDYYYANRTLVGTLVILPQEVSVKSVADAIANLEQPYTATVKNLSDLLPVMPTGVSNAGIVVAGGKELKNAGTYEFEVNLEPVSSNYVVSSTSVSGQLTITPIELLISLKQASFDYVVSQMPVLEINDYSSNLLGNDECEIKLNQPESCNAGTYTATIKSISNGNYVVSEESELSYTINKIKVTLSGVIFVDREEVFSGQYFRPVLDGEDNIPDYLTAKYSIVGQSQSSAKDVGVYTFACTFVSSDNNIEAPDGLTATLTIKQRPIEIVFTENIKDGVVGIENMVKVSFDNVPSGEIVAHSVSFVQDTQTASTYICKVDVTDSNYTVVGSKEYSFVLTANKIVVSSSDNKEVSFIGKFAGAAGASVKASTNLMLLDEINKWDVERYTAYNIVFNSFEDQPVKASIKVADFASSSKSLKIYAYNNGQFNEIEYVIEGDNAVFEIKKNGDYVFVDEKESTNIVLYIIIASVSTVAVATAVVTPITVVKLKKRKVEAKSNNVQDEK